MTTSTTPSTSPLAFGPDEVLLRDQARRFLDEFGSPTALRRIVGRDPRAVYTRGELPGYDRRAWERGVELGWSAMAVPESCGGMGATMVGISAVMEEVGRHAFPSPLVSTLIATLALRGSSCGAAHQWLRAIAAGTTVSLALIGPLGRFLLDETGVTSCRRDGCLVLSGAAFFVEDAFKADAFLVAARGDEGLCLAMVRRDAPGLRLVRHHILDLTRDQGHLELSEVRVSEEDIVASPKLGLALLSKAWPSVLAVVSADLVGTSEWLLQTTVEYAKVRKQFDRSLGFFQAVKHPLVNAMMAIDLARSLLYRAARSIDVEDDRSEIHARMAKSAASDAAAFMSGRAVQLHGGIGFTWDCDVHFFFKRNLHNQALYGDGVHQRKKLADILVGPLPAPSAGDGKS